VNKWDNWDTVKNVYNIEDLNLNLKPKPAKEGEGGSEFTYDIL
jgi:hypothetical protein